MKQRKTKELDLVILSVDIPRSVKDELDRHMRTRDESYRKFTERALKQQIKKDRGGGEDDE
ncbi:MAG TPA: hypothetical protein VHG72_21865 [Polyangia bacterium]|nr:hypothetical protein [Polyangia bacterium]